MVLPMNVCLCARWCDQLKEKRVFFVVVFVCLFVVVVFVKSLLLMTNRPFCGDFHNTFAIFIRSNTFIKMGSM